MLQNSCKTLGYKKKMVYKIPPGGGGGGVNHIQPVAYMKTVCQSTRLAVSSDQCHLNLNDKMDGLSIISILLINQIKPWTKV